MEIKVGGTAIAYKDSSGIVRGVALVLTGDEVADAIDMYVLSRGIKVNGPRTVSVNGVLCKEGLVYVDPSGSVTIEDR